MTEVPAQLSTDVKVLRLLLKLFYPEEKVLDHSGEGEEDTHPALVSFMDGDIKLIIALLPGSPEQREEKGSDWRPCYVTLDRWRRERG